MNNLLSLSLLLILFSACSNQSGKNPESQILYFGEDIITMSGNKPNYVESIVTNSDTIVFVGSLSEAEKRFQSARKSNLMGRTLLPGFIIK